jgi:hypothetical protein
MKKASPRDTSRHSADIQQQVDDLKGLTLSTVSADKIQDPLNSMGTTCRT